MSSDDRFSFLLTALISAAVMLVTSQMRGVAQPAERFPPRAGVSSSSGPVGPPPAEPPPDQAAADALAAAAEDRVRSLFLARGWPDFAQAVVFHPLTGDGLASGLEEGPPYHLVIERDGSGHWTQRGLSGSRSQPPGIPVASATRALHAALPDCGSDSDERAAFVRALWRQGVLRFGAHGALFADEVPGSTLRLPAGFVRERYVAPQDSRPRDTRPTAASRPGGDRVRIRFGSTTLDAAIAMTDVARGKGLMERTSLDKGEGMLFVYRTPDARSFWMKNCKIPLDILFLADDGEVLSVTTLQPADPAVREADLPRARSPAPCRLVLEVAGGSSEKFGIRTGSRLGLPESTSRLFPQADP